MPQLEQAPQTIPDFDPLAHAKQDAAVNHRGEAIAIYYDLLTDPNTGQIDPQAAADFALYLENRPSKDSEGNIVDPATGQTVEGDYFEKQREIQYDGSQAPAYEDMDATEIGKVLVTANDNADRTTADNAKELRPEKIKAAAEEMGLIELARELAKANLYEDGIVSDILTDTLIDKMASFSEKMSHEGLAEGEADDALLNPIMNYIDKAEAELKEAEKSQNPEVEQASEPAPTPALTPEPEQSEVTDPAQAHDVIDLTPEKEAAVMADLESELNQRYGQILEEYGILGNQIKLLDDEFKVTEKIIINDAYDEEGDQIFVIEFQPNTADGEPTYEKLNSTEFLQLIQNTDKYLLSPRRKRHSDPEGAHQGFMEEHSADIRNKIRSERNHNGDDSQSKLSLYERVKLFGLNAMTGNLTSKEKRRFKIGAGVGALAVVAGGVAAIKYGVNPFDQPDQVSDAATNHQKLLDIMDTDKLQTLENLNTDVAPPKAGAQTPMEVASTIPAAEAADQMASFNVSPGEGFTHVIERAADSYGVNNLTDVQLYEAYQHLERMGAIDQANTYIMANGDLGIADPSQAVNIDSSALEDVLKKGKKK